PRSMPDRDCVVPGNWPGRQSPRHAGGCCASRAIAARGDGPRSKSVRSIPRHVRFEDCSGALGRSGGGPPYRLGTDPNNVAALRNLGQILHFTGRSEAGIPLIEKALRLSPRDAGIGFDLLNLGGSYMVVGRTDEALVELRKAVAALPQIFYAHLSLA